MENRTVQSGFVKSVLQVFSGSRFRTPGSLKTLDSDPIRRDENRQGDRDHVSGSTSDEVVLTEEITDSAASLDEGPSRSYHYDGGSPTFTNGGSSSGFRYFRNDAVGIDQGQGGISSPAGEQSKMDKFPSDPSSFPLSRPVAGYISDHLKKPSYVSAHSSTQDHELIHEHSEHLSIARMGQWDPQNVTQRDPKRPKERSRDKAYKQRFSMGSSSVQGYRTNVVFQTSVNFGVQGAGNQSFKNTPAPSGRGHGIGSGFLPPSPLRHGDSQYPDGSFEIFLVFNGGTTVHRVWDSMHVSQLISEAGTIFGVDPQDLALILFSGSPSSIPRTGRVSGPPRIAPGSTVLVFEVPQAEMPMPTPSRELIPHSHDPVDHQSSLSGLSPKLLASFKLPKFDGATRSWKTWEKAFTRFLGIHQLDHVLEKDFLTTLWTAPGAKAANKMVFFLIEDAVATGTLASRLVRQATKWNGHEAFVMLRNGYVFSGPQTATILLAELSRIRLKRDEDASTFCFRLVELIEDLELIPGDAAVFLTDTQKLGYFLSAIRHESSLQSVYTQLQSEQLRGTVTFERACQELHHRVEAMRADDYLDSRPGRVLVSTEGKKNGQNAVPLVKLPCLAKDCAELIQPYLPLCKLCYLQCMAGKIPSLPLRDNLGNATFNTRTKMLDFPAAVPQARFPKKGMKKGKKLLVAGIPVSGGNSISE